MIEIGGTVGDIESLPFLEAIRQVRTEPRTFRPHFSKKAVPFATQRE